MGPSRADLLHIDEHLGPIMADHLRACQDTPDKQGQRWYKHQDTSLVWTRAATTYFMIVDERATDVLRAWDVCDKD